MTQPVVPSPRAPKALLLTLVKTLSGVQSVWNTGQRGLLGYRPGTERAWCLVGLQGIQEYGTDELRVVWNAERNANDEFVYGQRTATMTLQCFSLDPSLEAYDLAERIRFRLRTQEARAIMVPTVGVRTFGKVVQLPALENAQQGTLSHIVLRASLDVSINYVIGGDPGDPNGGGVIASAPVPAPVVGGNLLP